MPASVAELARTRGEAIDGYSYAFLDSISKREVRRALLKAVAIPGYQVPFGSRELPIARGWGTGGLQITLSILGPGDVVKVIDQGDDASVNATNLRRLIERTTGLPTTFDTRQATIVQSRHRIPEEPLAGNQVLVLQCPNPEPLRPVEPSMAVARRMHAEADYSRVWVSIYEGIVRRGELTKGADYPVMVNDRFVMATTPIPRWDVPKLDNAPFLTLIGAGREKRIYAVPPHTSVKPLEFEDYHFRVESFDGRSCHFCGATDTFMDETVDDAGRQRWACNDRSYCEARQAGGR